MSPKLRILIVDDDRSLVLVANRILQKEGFDVLTAFDGVEGLQKAREEKPDLIILDVMMPKRDGYEVCRDLQEDPDTARIPVLFLSIKGGGIISEGGGLKYQLKALEAGAIDFLFKPVRATELVERVKSLLWFSNRETISGKVASPKARILIIDDNRSLVRLIERALQKEGFDALTAFDGQEGLQKAQEEKPDLIVLDVIMPELNGFRVLDLVRRHSSIPVIMLTTERYVDSVKKAQTLGADDFLAKPFDTQDLLARIRAKLRHAEVEVL